MKLEKIKQEFIQFMEEMHAGNPYPRNFYGCLIPIIIEPEPVSQERIMELTGYSQATISLTIQKIQLLMPVRTIKKIGVRKRYYEYSSPNQFIIDLTNKRVNVQDVDITSIEPFRERVLRAYKTSKSYKRFLDYLNNLLLYLNLIHELRTKNAILLEQTIEGRELGELNLQGSGVLEKAPLAQFIAEMRASSKEYATLPRTYRNESDEYQSLKTEFFSTIKSNFNPLYSQVIVNQFSVIHSVIIEGRTTQEEIEKSTLLPRSTVSETLSSAVDRGIIRIIRNKGSRIKYYELAILFPDLMLSYFDRTANYIATMNQRLASFIKEIRNTRLKSEKASKFLNFLLTLEEGYRLSYAFAINMKVEMLSRLREEFEKGFQFI